MNILYEEDGSFKVGSIMADNTTSLQIESLSGKRSKVKAANVMLRFTQPALAEFMAQAETLSETIDVEFLWECCPPDEFGSEQIAAEYFGHTPSALEAAAVLIRLHGAPVYFHKKGKGRYRAAPPEVLRAALAGVEKKRQQLALQSRYTEQLTRFELPPEFAADLEQSLPRHGGAEPSGAGGAAKQTLPQSSGFASNVLHLLYKPDRNTIEAKALEAACAATHLSAAHLLQRCGAIPSTHAYHLQKFLFEYFPRGTSLPHVGMSSWGELPLASVNAFSIDDAATTEIDDAFSVEKLTGGNWRIGVHIAAPALGLPRDSEGDKIAAKRLSTVYMPGRKITMLPDNVVEAFTLNADHICPALSMYNEIDGDTLEILHHESRVERVHIAANLRHDTLEPLFNEETLAAGKLDYPYANELAMLWNLAQKLEAGRGKPADNNAQQVDYNFHIENDPESENCRVSITQRRRGSPIDKVVSELMILINSEWGRQLDEHGFVGIYRTQQNGKVKMSTIAAPHQGLGVAQYMWSSSPLRRYVDLVNQRQIVAMLRNEPPAYPKNDPALYITVQEFDTMYGIYGEFQKNMERYWSLRWLQQEQASMEALSPTLSRAAGEGANESPRELVVTAVVLRENLVRLLNIPLTLRVPSLPELPANTRVQLTVGGIDLLDLNLQTRYLATPGDAV